MASNIYYDETNLMFEITSENLDILNTSETLYFQLKTYDYSFPIFNVVLDFIHSMGGIY